MVTSADQNFLLRQLGFESNFYGHLLTRQPQPISTMTKRFLKETRGTEYSGLERGMVSGAMTLSITCTWANGIWQN
jgi:hypothetical protein